MTKEHLYDPYIIVEGETISSLSENVTEYILQGYICSGGVSVVNNYSVSVGPNFMMPSYKVFFIQAMTRKIMDE